MRIHICFLRLLSDLFFVPLTICLGNLSIYVFSFYCCITSTTSLKAKKKHPYIIPQFCGSEVRSEMWYDWRDPTSVSVRGQQGCLCLWRLWGRICFRAQAVHRQNSEPFGCLATLACSVFTPATQPHILFTLGSLFDWLMGLPLLLLKVHAFTSDPCG